MFLIIYFIKWINHSMMSQKIKPFIIKLFSLICYNTNIGSYEVLFMKKYSYFKILVATLMLGMITFLSGCVAYPTYPNGYGYYTASPYTYSDCYPYYCGYGYGWYGYGGWWGHSYYHGGYRGGYHGGGWSHGGWGGHVSGGTSTGGHYH
jgi:hypothetical protein